MLSRTVDSLLGVPKRKT